ncbi:hypothetical protein HYH03_011456 [Edaphochlamys debaryana]|uniref:Glycosyltransferase 2-like domain-containing protein n=1 Tax=Edaphochlamys debaryana TaxID=47281 RepID=A0A836BVL1_9CHLO|nr:hypothetical protein HYH03_011456 [Edaphochlamys debaryana]|eukprot:KAG2490152.1 hypothetical protein HYH03_011456 [Edaphochlamys debaryana]
MRTSCRGAGMPCEVIVNVDNPHEAGLWAQAASASEGALVPIFSANLHEARGYNRGAKAARGKILIIWQVVDFAPSVIRSDLFHELGGLDEGMSRPGDCGVVGDWELSQRTWAAGWQVGYYFLQGRGDDGHMGSTHQGAGFVACWVRQRDVAGPTYHKRYAAATTYGMGVCEHAWRLNLQTFTLAGDCPYGSEDTRWPDNCTLASGGATQPLAGAR